MLVARRRFSNSLGVARPLWLEAFKSSRLPTQRELRWLLKFLWMGLVIHKVPGNFTISSTVSGGTGGAGFTACIAGSVLSEAISTELVERSASRSKAPS